MENEQKRADESIKEQLEKLQQEAYMEGYFHAIEILKEHIVHKKRQSSRESSD